MREPGANGAHNVEWWRMRPATAIALALMLASGLGAFFELRGDVEAQAKLDVARAEGVNLRFRWIEGQVARDIAEIKALIRDLNRKIDQKADKE